MPPPVITSVTLTPGNGTVDYQIDGTDLSTGTFALYIVPNDVGGLGGQYPDTWTATQINGSVVGVLAEDFGSLTTYYQFIVIDLDGQGAVSTPILMPLPGAETTLATSWKQNTFVTTNSSEAVDTDDQYIQSDLVNKSGPTGKITGEVISATESEITWALDSRSADGLTYVATVENVWLGMQGNLTQANQASMGVAFYSAGVRVR